MSTDRRRARRRIAAIAFAVTSLPGVAAAGDGRLEINQACVATGCFPGDAPGLPIETAANRSYVLTSDVSVGAMTDPGLLVGAGSTLDLNGFTVAGLVTCNGTPATCSESGVNSGGVYLGAGAVVRNGTIRGMRGHGVMGEPFSRVEGVEVQQNAAGGVTSYGDATGMVVQDCQIHHNGGSGVQMLAAGGANGARVLRNTIHGNGFRGVQGSISLLVDNAITNNANQGALLGTLDGTSGYRGNQFWSNNGGNQNVQISGGVSIGPNVCGTGVCP